MKPRRLLPFVVLFVIGWHQVQAAFGEPPGGRPAVPLPRYLCECLRYCAKPLPPPPCGNYAARCDDYGRKPPPRICPSEYKSGCDSYCPKPLPHCLPMPLCP